MDEGCDIALNRSEDVGDGRRNNNARRRRISGGRGEGKEEEREGGGGRKGEGEELRPSITPITAA